MTRKERVEVASVVPERYRRQDRATSLLLYLALTRDLDSGKKKSAREMIDSSGAIRSAVVFATLAAEQYALSRIPGFPPNRREYHQGMFSTYLSRVGEDYARHVIREARRQWREIRAERRDRGEIWEAMDAATWKDPGWKATDLLQVGDSYLRSTGGDHTTFRISILGEARRLLDAGQHPNPFTSRQEAQPA